ncbi:MAG: hypothetical protein ABL997_04445 [Planctomycetota bacterium]
MHKTLLSLTAIAVATASLSAQCVAPTGTQNLETTYFGTTFYANLTPPLYGVNIDPGVAIRCDLSVSANINITAVGANFLNDGTAPAGVPVPNLIGAPNGTCEVWVVPSDTVLNPVLFTANPYTHNPSVPPIAPWTHLSNQASHVSNLVYAAPDTPSTATFSPPLTLAPGNYAVVFVFVPTGVATIPPGTGVPANPATDRIHPLFTNMNTQPGPTTYTDGFITISNPGVQSPAFVNGALSPTSVTPYMPNFNITYSLGANVAYSTQYGVGCYDRKQTFYESWTNGTMDIDAQAGVNGLDFFNIGSNYIVNTNAAPGLIVAPGSSVGAVQINTQAPALTTGAWDDALATPITMPFAFAYPSNPVGSTTLQISSNGIVYFETTTATFGFYDGYAGFLAGRAAIAAGWSDFEPADLNTFLGGTGNIWYDTDNASYVAVTWQGVQIWNEAANLNTVQIVLSNGGGVQIRYGAGGMNSTNAPILVGFTPGNGSVDPSSGVTPRLAPDFSVAAGGGGYVSGDGAAPAVISLANRPNVGNALTINTNNIDPSGLINITLISGASLPGIDLAAIGMAGCAANINLPEIASNLGIVGGGSDSWFALGSIPGAFAGVNLYAQSAQLTTGVPSYNPANILVSNAVCIHFDLF